MCTYAQCECAAGFVGCGTSAHPCEPYCEHCSSEHGVCVSPGNCTCLSGYAGANCTVDCGCNGHAACPDPAATMPPAMPVCAVCLDNTTGPTCSECLPGFHGNASDGMQCAPCACNGHGDPAQNLCNATTGVCACTGHTRGDNCEQCEDDYVGYEGGEKTLMMSTILFAALPYI